MPYYVNAFTPRTEIGASLGNIAQALFAGKETPNDAAKRQLEERRAQAYIDSQEAAAGLDRAKTEDTIALMEGRRGYGLPQLRVQFGDQADAIHNYAMKGEGELPTLDADGLRFISSLFATADAVNAGGGNADQIGKARQHQIETDQDADMLAGRISPTVFNQLRGRDVVGMNANGVRYNKFDMGVPLDVPDFAKKLYDADLSATNALAEDRRASASKTTNDIRVTNEKLGIEKKKADRDKLVATYVGDDANGNPIYEYVPQAVGGRFTKPRTGTAKNPTGITIKPKGMGDIDNNIRAVLGVEQDEPFPGATLSAVRGRINQLAKEAGLSGAYTEDILYQAIRDVGVQLGDDAFRYDPGMLSFERSGKDVLSRVPGAPAAPKPAQQTQQPRAVPDINTWLQQARKANPGATDQQLRQYYINKYGA
jgi:hypothetical protein